MKQGTRVSLYFLDGFSPRIRVGHSLMEPYGKRNVFRYKVLMPGEFRRAGTEESDLVVAQTHDTPQEKLFYGILCDTKFQLLWFYKTNNEEGIKKYVIWSSHALYQNW